MDFQENQTNQENQNNDIFVVNGVANYSFVKGSPNTASTLSSLLGMFYKMGWYCKQWTEIKKHNESYKNISPVWRGVFYLGYASQFKKIVVELFEAKTNMILQNENVPQEEKDKWQKELKKLKSIFAKFSSQQQAINKIVPVGHPEGSSSKFAGWLGLPFFILFVVVILGFSLISSIVEGCYKVKGNIYTNTCGNYTFTFPLDDEIGLWRDNGFDNICQQNENEMICLSDIVLKNSDDFNLNTLTEGEENLLDKYTKKYAGNTTHCFKTKDTEGNFVNTCYMKVEGPKPTYFGFFTHNKTADIENFEKLMNSYKTLE